MKPYLRWFDEQRDRVVELRVTHLLVDVLVDLPVGNGVRRVDAGERAVLLLLCVEPDLRRLHPRSGGRDRLHPRAGEVGVLRALRDRPRTTADVVDRSALAIQELHPRDADVRRVLREGAVVEGLHRPRADLVLRDLVARAEEVPRVAERLEGAPAAVRLDQRIGEAQRRHGLRRVQLRLEAVLREDVDAVRLRPQREELRQLRVEADPGDLATRDLEHLLVRRGELAPVLRAQVGDLEAGIGHDLVVDDDGARVRELRDPVQRALVRGLLERRPLVLLEVDVLALDALRQRLERALGRVLGDLCAVEVDDVGHVARRERGEELLIVEAAPRVVDAAADRGSGDVGARVRDLVAGTESVDVERRRLSEGTPDGRRVRERRRDHGHTECGSRCDQREPLPTNEHLTLQDGKQKPDSAGLWERSHTKSRRMSRRTRD